MPTPTVAELRAEQSAFRLRRDTADAAWRASIDLETQITNATAPEKIAAAEERRQAALDAWDAAK